MAEGTAVAPVPLVDRLAHRKSLEPDAKPVELGLRLHLPLDEEFVRCRWRRQRRHVVVSSRKASIEHGKIMPRNSTLGSPSVKKV